MSTTLSIYTQPLSLCPQPCLFTHNLSLCPQPCLLSHNPCLYIHNPTSLHTTPVSVSTTPYLTHDPVSVSTTLNFDTQSLSPYPSAGSPCRPMLGRDKVRRTAIRTSSCCPGLLMPSGSLAARIIRASSGGRSATMRDARSTSICRLILNNRAKTAG